MKNTTTVIIIGSGPSAYAAAIACSNNDFHTIVIAEHQKNNSVILPLESVHPGIETLFELLGLPFILNKCSENVFDGIFVNNNFKPFGEDSNGVWQGHHINKTKFLLVLEEEVLRLGITILREKTIKILNDGKRVTGVETNRGKQLFSNFILDCSGKNNLAGRDLRFNKSFYSPPLIVWSGVTECIDPQIYCDLKTSFEMNNERWLWMAPHKNYSCTWTQLTLKESADLLPPSIFLPFRNSTKIKVSNMRWQLFRPIVANGLMLCGDAAGILDPASGKGIFTGIYSAIVAANNIKRCVASPQNEPFYLAEYDDWFVSMFLDSVKSLKSFYEENGLQWEIA